jgi:hypothetical protein
MYDIKSLNINCHFIDIIRMYSKNDAVRTVGTVPNRALVENYVWHTMRGKKKNLGVSVP